MLATLWDAWSSTVLDPAARTHWVYLLSSAAIVVGLGCTRQVGHVSPRAVWRRWTGASARVDALLILLRPLFFAFWAVPWALTAHGIAVFLVRRADHLLGRPEWFHISPWMVTVAYTLTLFVAWDLSRYLLHLAMHRVDALWQIHQVHHSADTLTPMTLHRVHPLESALYQARGVVVTGLVTALFYFLFRGAAVEQQLFGVNVVGVAFSAVGGNLRHSHTFWRWGARVERWFISPAQHQLHHARTGARTPVNLGTWLAVWDRLAGSLKIAGAHDAPSAFGVAARDRNHDPHHIGSVLVRPMMAFAARLVPRWTQPLTATGLRVGVYVAGLLLPSAAAAQQPAPTTEAPTPSPAPAPTSEPAPEPTPEPSDAPVAPTPEAPAPAPADEVPTETAAGGDTDDTDDTAATNDTADTKDTDDSDDTDLDFSDMYDEGTAKDTPAGAASSPAPPGNDAQPDGAREPDVDTRGVAADIAAPTVSIIGEPEDLPRIVGSAHRVDEATLERDENDDIERVLRTVPGVYVRGEDGFGLRPNIGLRGVDANRSSKITLMEDGVLLGPAPYAAPAAYYFPLTTRMVGVEVFKGPAAVRHGPNTIGGAINMVTRDIPRDNNGAIDLALGQRGYGKVHGYWGRSWKHFGMLVEGVRLQSNGFKEIDGGGDTGFGKNEGMLKLRANLDPAARVYQQFDAKVGIATERSNETYLGLTDADFEANPYRRYVASNKGLMTWWRSQAQLSYLLAYEDLVEFQATAYRHDFSRAWTKFNNFRGGPGIDDIMADNGAGQSAVYLAILRGEEDTADSDQVMLIGTNDRRYVSQGVQTVLRVSPRTRYVDQHIEFGARIHGDAIERDHTEDGYLMIASTLVPEGSDTVQTALNRGAAVAGALHLHDEIVIVDRVTLSPGARVELIRTTFDNNLADSRATNFNAVFIPGGGVHVRATDWLGVLAGVHSGFSPVAPGQSDDVSPERSVNYEGGLRFGGAPLKGFTGEAIGFFNDYSNLTGECTFAQGCDDTNIGDQFNAGKVKVAGAELAAGLERRFDRGGWLDTDANYTFTWSQFERSFVSASPQFGIVEAGDALPYLPEHVASLKFAGGMKRWGLWGTLAFNGAMRDVPGQGPIPDAERIDPFLTLDLGGRVWFNERASIYLNIMNVTGARYMVSRRPVGARPGRPRFGSLGFKYEFGP